MADLAKLVVRLEAQTAAYQKDLKKSTQTLRKFDKNASKSFKNLSKSSNGAAQSLKGFLGPLLAVVSASAGFNKLVAVTREFDVLNAQLITATGSAEGAGVAFEALQQFAKDTPFDLATTTKAFTQLVNLGLTPSERALRSYGDTASAMGKDIGQLVEAVADATTGEFERLKEFGIKTKSEGDKVAFTFRGITTKIGKNAGEIEEFLTKLGENNFAGAMANRMATLDGAISNLGDSWDGLFRTIAGQGSDEVMADAVRTATAAIEEFDDLINSGSIAAGIEALGGKFSGFGEDVARSLDAISFLFEDAAQYWGESGQDAGGAITDAFSNLPENIRAFIQIMTVEVAALIDKLGAYGSEAADKLKFWDGDTFDLETALKTANDARRRGIADIITERNEAVGSFTAQSAAALGLLEKYKAINVEKDKDKSDKLAGFKTGGDGEEESKDFTKDIEKIQAKLMTEEESLKSSYDRRNEIIQGAREANQISEKLFNELSLKNKKQYDDKAAKMEAAKQAGTLNNYQQMFDGLAGIAEAAGGKQSKAYKVLFAASKAFAIAESIVKIQAGIANAAALPFPANLGAMATVVSQTAGIVSTIQGTKMQSFDGGGFTGSGPRSGGLDGKGGFTAMLHPNESVIDHTRGQGGSTVNIHNYAGADVSTEDNGGQIDIIINKVKASIGDDINRGTGVGVTMQSMFGLNRRGAV